MPFEVLLLICAFSSWIAAHVYRRHAVDRRILAMPEARSAHQVPTPTGGGIAIIIVFAFALFDLWLVDLVSDRLVLAWAGPLLVAVVGFVDDLRPLHWKVRFPLFLIGCGWSMSWVGFPTLNIGGIAIELGLLGWAFGTVSLLWLQNLYNFLDGIDGLAISEAIFCCVGVWVIGGGLESNDWNVAMLLLLAVSFGFAAINWPKAALFMGDAGSGFLGLSLGILALAQGQVSVWVWMILLGWFITDGCLTILIRLIRGEPISQAHSLHAYQHLSRRFGASRVLVGIIAVNCIWLLPIAHWAHNAPDHGALLLIFAAAPLLICQFVLGAGQTEPRLALVKM